MIHVIIAELQILYYIYSSISHLKILIVSVRLMLLGINDCYWGFFCLEVFSTYNIHEINGRILFNSVRTNVDLAGCPVSIKETR
jgi:hypothetical protein